MGRKYVAFQRCWFKIDIMEEHQPYDPQVYKRLELVQKQFKRHSAEQKAQQVMEKRQQLLGWLAQNKQNIIRWAIYIFLVLLVLAVIGATIAEAVKQ
jgi:hypothetical protein